MPAAASAGAGDRERDAGAAPVHLLGVDHAEHALGVAAEPLQLRDAVQAPLARLLDRRPTARDCSRSCLAATGRMTSRANLRQYCWNSCCSSLSLKSTLRAFRDACRRVDCPVNQGLTD